MNKELFSKICNEYKLQPKNLQLYEEAFTHVSYSFENKLNYNYEKLEFLGDAVIGKNIALYLFKKYNDMSVGDMSKTKIIMVQSRTLAKASEVMGLRDLINVGKSVGDKKNITENIMEDVFESFIGALFLDLGEKKCFYVLKRTIIHFYEINWLKDTVDYKTMLQELASKSLGKSISYNNIYIPSESKYSSTITYMDKKIGFAKGQRIKDAEHDAAKIAYNKFLKGEIK